MGDLIMDEIYERILFAGYGLKLNSCRRTRTSLLCSTEKGMFTLKKSMNDSQYVLFESAARQKLIENGFSNINKFIITSDDKPYFECMDDIYTLEPYTTLTNTENENMPQMIEAAKTLAMLHRASHGLIFENGRSGLFKLPTLYSKRMCELKKIRKGISKRKCYDLTDMVIKENYDYFFMRAKTASDILSQSGYLKLCEDADKDGLFIHSSFKSGNFMKNELSGNIFIDSFSKCAFDIPIKDLAYFMRRLMKNPEFDVVCCKRIIDNYCIIRPINDDEKQVLYSMLVFPWKFMNLCNEYYNKRRTYCMQPAYERFERCVESSINEETIIKSLFK
jgi:CotS family spore coat protein